MNKNIIWLIVVSIFIYTYILLNNTSFNKEIEYRQTLEYTRKPEITKALVTGYTSDVLETDNTPFLTAWQTKVRDGVIACPRNISFGTKVIIDMKEYICEDRTNIKIDGIFDIWFPTKKEAFNWGKQVKEIEIYLNK